ncbi:MAG: hypothetical protein LUD27_08540 [Clostridia bacterium]|nr:hypothetical protein [Clostridia bacterium]
MTKKNWIISTVIFLCVIASITVFSFVYHSQSGAWFHWSVYLIAVSLFVIYVIGCFIFARKSDDKFYRRLRLSDFDIQREYRWKNSIFCIDFASKRIACNLLLKPVISFNELVGFNVEISDRTQLQILPQNKRSISLSVSVMGGDDNSLFHFNMFEVIADADDLENEDRVNFDNLMPEYPLLNNLVELQQDLTKVIEYNNIKK